MSIVGEEVLIMIYNHFFIFQRVENFYIQIAGRPLNTFFPQDKYGVQAQQVLKGAAALKTGGRAQPLQPKEGVTNDAKPTSTNGPPKKIVEKVDIDRNQLFYCSHMNRKPGTFKSNIFEISFQPSFDKTAKTLAKLPLNLLSRESRAKFEKHVPNWWEAYRNINFITLMAKTCPLPEDYKKIKYNFKKLKEKTKGNKNFKLQEEIPDAGVQLAALVNKQLEYESVASFAVKAIRKVFTPALLGEKNQVVLDKSSKNFLVFLFLKSSIS